LARSDQGDALLNIVLKSAAADRKIEGSADYAQKNDDSDYMSGSGKMVISRCGRGRLIV
jgi:hypothetical protein